MTMIQCISPIDGSVYAERPAMEAAAASAAVARARAAQKDWAKRPLEDRVKLVLNGVARLNEMVDEVVPELAWQMGRPIRYGGEFRGFNERSNYVASIAADALAPIVVEDSASFERRIERVAAWRRLRHRAVELSLHDGDQHGCAGADGRQHRHHQACQPDAFWSASAWCAPSSRPAFRKMSSRTSSSIMRPPLR